LGAGWTWRSAAAVAVIVGLSMPGVPARADDTQVIEQMKEQIQDLQIKINALVEAQKNMQGAQQKAVPAKGTNQVVNGTDKIKLAISGQIDRGALYFDDGAENNLFNVDNGNSTTRIRFIGTAKPDDDLTISTNLEFDLCSNASDRIDQTQENTGVDGDTLFRIRRASVSVGSVTSASARSARTRRRPTTSRRSTSPAPTTPRSPPSPTSAATCSSATTPTSTAAA